MLSKRCRILIEVRDENFKVVEKLQVNDIEWYSDRIKPEIHSYVNDCDQEAKINRGVLQCYITTN